MFIAILAVYKLYLGKIGVHKRTKQHFLFVISEYVYIGMFCLIWKITILILTKCLSYETLFSSFRIS